MAFVLRLSPLVKGVGMYGTTTFTDLKQSPIAGEDPEKLAEFEARIARGEKVEPPDWMPAEYRRQLIRMIEQHAHSEIVGALPEGKWIPHAPGFRRKLALIAKVQDEVGHAQLLYRARSEEHTSELQSPTN